MALHRPSLRVVFGLALSACLVPTPGHAQTKYPDRPVKVLIGFTAGGGTDVAGRVIAQKLSEATGQTFVVENRPGASGLIATEAVAKAPADGYTIMVGSQTTLAVAPALYRKAHLDATRDFAGIAMIGISPLVAVVNPSLPVHSIKELIALSKEKNGTMNFASGGVGNLDHLVAGIRDGHATAVLAASIFHFGEHTVREAKQHMARAGLPMRLDA